MQPSNGRYTLLLGTCALIPPYNSMFGRSANINFNRETMRNLLSETDDLAAINTIQLAKSDIITMASASGKEVKIKGGWDSERGVIFLLVKDNSTKDIFGMAGFSTTVTHTEGSKNINPNALFQFNTVSRFRQKKNRQGDMEYVPDETNLLLGTTSYEKGSGRSNFDLGVANRPKDTLEMTRQTAGEDSTILPVGSEGLAGGLLSKGENLDIQAAATRSLQAMSVSSQCLGSLDSDDANRALLGGAMASEILNEAKINELSLLHALFQGGNSSRKEATVSLEKLKATISGFNLNIINKSGYKTTSNLSKWNSRSAELAANIANSIPAYMIQSGILGCDFGISNYQAMDGYSNTFRWMGNKGKGGNSTVFLPIDNLNKALATRRFEQRIRGLFFPNITKGRKVTMQVRCRLTSDMGIELEVDGTCRSSVAPTFSLSKWGTVTAGADDLAKQGKALWDMANIIRETVDA